MKSETSQSLVLRQGLIQTSLGGNLSGQIEQGIAPIFLEKPLLNQAILGQSSSNYRYTDMNLIEQLDHYR